MRTFMHAIARWMAILGGLVLLALVVLTNLSIVGRLLNTLGHSDFIESQLPAISSWLTEFSPINGDFEIVEVGIAFAIFAFFPWCMINRGHAQVDIFTVKLPKKISDTLELIWDILFVFVLGVISWRLYVGMSDKVRYGETTFLLEFPVWWGFAVCAAASAVATFIACYVVYARAREIAGLDSGLPDAENLKP